MPWSAFYVGETAVTLHKVIVLFTCRAHSHSLLIVPYFTGIENIFPPVYCRRYL